jgi:hypothetical protein
MYCSIPGLLPPLQVEEPSWVMQRGEISKKVSRLSVTFVFTPQEAEATLTAADVGAVTPAQSL